MEIEYATRSQPPKVNVPWLLVLIGCAVEEVIASSLVYAVQEPPPFLIVFVILPFVVLAAALLWRLLHSRGLL